MRLRQMNLYLLRLLVFLITFTFGLLASPVQFKPMGSGMGSTIDGRQPCTFTPYESGYFGKVVVWSCSYSDEAKAANAMMRDAQKYHIIRASDSRYIVSYSVEETDYHCIFRVDGKRVTDICSTSLWQASLLERQKF